MTLAQYLRLVAAKANLRSCDLDDAARADIALLHAAGVSIIGAANHVFSAKEG